MTRIPFALLLVPTIALLPLLSGRLFNSPAWLKVGLLAAALALPATAVMARYRVELDPEGAEFLRRRRVAAALITLMAVAAVWMVGGVDLENEVPLDLVGSGEANATRFDVAVELPARGSLRDLEAVGGGVRVFFPKPDNPRIQRLVLDAPPVGNDIDLIVRWRLPVWADVGEVAVAVVAVDEAG